MTGGGGGMHDGEQDEGILDAFERRLINILGESYTATSKNKRTELEKKVKDLGRNTVRDIKKVCVYGVVSVTNMASEDVVVVVGFSSRWRQFNCLMTLPRMPSVF